MADNIWCPETHKHLITIDHGLVLNVANLQTIGEVRRGSIYSMAGALLCHVEDLQAGYESTRPIPDALKLALSDEAHQQNRPMNKTTDQPTPEEPAHGRQQQEHDQSRGLPEKSEGGGDGPKKPEPPVAPRPSGTATDSLKAGAIKRDKDGEAIADDKTIV